MVQRRNFLKYSLTGIAGLGVFKSGTVISNGLRSQTQSLQDDFVVNVRHFGAAGDGKQDDRKAIQDAVDSVSKSGGSIYIPPGEYALSRDEQHFCGVRLYSNTQLIGSGRGNTILKWMDSVPDDSHHYVVAANEGFVENVTIRDLTIDGNKSRTDKDFNIVGEGIEMDGRNICISNVHIKDVLGEGIDCDRSDGIMIHNCIIENSGGNGIHCSDPQARNVQISQCITRNCAHGRRRSGNVRYGGLVIRGSGIFVSHHRSINDAQIANIEGQGMDYDSELSLQQVVGYSESVDARGFRVGMSGHVQMNACRAMLINSDEPVIRIDDFSGIVTIQSSYLESNSGVAISGTVNHSSSSRNMDSGLRLHDCHIQRHSNHGDLVNLSFSGKSHISLLGNRFRGGPVNISSLADSALTGGIIANNSFGDGLIVKDAIQDLVQDSNYIAG